MTELGGVTKSSVRAILEVADAEGKFAGFPLRAVERVYPGLPETEDLTLKAAFMLEDHQEIMATLGGTEDPRNKPCRVQVLVKDNDGHYQVNRPAIPGIVQRVMGPEGDSNDAVPATIEITIKAGS